tara:strand:- start:1084 stop:1326 length:243 start_codon:yes stop_codon:yes gene_type:complete
MGKRAKNKKDGRPKPESGRTKPPSGLSEGTGMPKSKNAGKKARAAQRALLAQQLDGKGSGFESAYSAPQKKNARRGNFAY